MFPDLETCFTHYYRDPIVTIIRRVPPLPDLSRGEKWIAGKRIRRREVVWIVSRFMNIMQSGLFVSDHSYSTLSSSSAGLTGASKKQGKSANDEGMKAEHCAVCGRRVSALSGLT